LIVTTKPYKSNSIKRTYKRSGTVQPTFWEIGRNNLPFYEIIYETGNKSLASYDSDEEAEKALTEHHRRAMTGEPATPLSTARPDVPGGPITTWVAERIKKVLVYDTHPGDYLGDQVVQADDVRAAFEKAVADKSMQGMVHLPTVLADVRDMTNAVHVQTPENRQDSQFKQKEDRELDLAFLEAVS
jgi:hypothetical protein